MTLRSVAGSIGDVELVAEVISSGSCEAQPAMREASSPKIKIEDFNKLLLPSSKKLPATTMCLQTGHRVTGQSKSREFETFIRIAQNELDEQDAPGGAELLIPCTQVLAYLPASGTIPVLPSSFIASN